MKKSTFNKLKNKYISEGYTVFQYVEPKSNIYIRHAKFTLDEILEKIKNKEEKTYKGKIDYKGFNFKIRGYRLQTYISGTTCVKCGLEASFFSLDSGFTRIGLENPHLNLVAIDEYGQERLMTSDHIVPLSLGGYDGVENRQCLCAKCNVEKGNSDEDKTYGYFKEDILKNA